VSAGLPGRAPRHGWRARNKAGWIGLTIALLLAWVFTAWPQLDLWASGLFHDAGGRFVGDDFAFIRFIYRDIPLSGRLYALVGLVVIVVSIWRPHPLGGRWSRRLAALAWVSILGSGLLVNAGLKEYWGRARPVQVSQFGGTQHFSPALVPTDQCRHNCSFVSGHATSGYILMAVGLMGSVATRRRWFWIGVAWGAVVSLARIAEGGHFLSDTLFAGLAVWASGWLIREAWLRHVALRWRRLRRSREALGVRS
jgi:lipid A 4'-phosphatase